VSSLTSLTFDVDTIERKSLIVVEKYVRIAEFNTHSNFKVNKFMLERITFVLILRSIKTSRVLINKHLHSIFFNGNPLLSNFSFIIKLIVVVLKIIRLTEPY
jgi:hypothetical protein